MARIILAFKKEITMMKNVFKIALTLSILTIGSNSLFAQEQNHEIGIRLEGFNSFDFIYKKQKDQNKFIRYRLFSTDVRYRKLEESSNFSFSSGFAIGKEKRKEITDRLYFIHGIEPSLFFSINNSEDEVQTSVRPSIGYVLGFQYTFNSFYINVESIPAISGTFRTEQEGLEINAGFRSSGVAMTIAYQFATKKKK